MPKNPKKAKPLLEIPKIIRLSIRILSFLSTKMMVLFAAKLFTSPIKHRIPKRELEMDRLSRQEMVLIPAIGRKVNVYHFGNSPKKIILVHGWSGRGTQLVKFAEELVALGYETVSFDAPAHGKSPGNRSQMLDFIATIVEVGKQFGPFEGAIGHSLGGMSLMNACTLGLDIQKLVIIGSGDQVKDILDDFVRKLKMEPKYSDLLRLYFEKKASRSMDSYSAYHAAEQIEIPVLVIHDQQDTEVGVASAIHIHQHLKNGQLMLTEHLGHRKILGNSDVIERVMGFLTSKEKG